jgi:hypothetical protein
VELLILASQHVRKIGSTDPYGRTPSGLGRLLTAIGIIGLVYVGLQSAAGGGPAGFALSETAIAVPQLLQ